MPKLNDTQAILLSAASQRSSGSLFPLPDKFASGGVRVAKAIDALMALGLVEERDTSDPAEVRRVGGDLSFGLYITTAGLTAIGVEAEPEQEQEAGEPAGQETPAPARQTKTATVVALLSRETGATLAELIEATGWLPHTTRAALTGLKKKGHIIEKARRDDATCYRITGAAA